jgi:hypothetical protein
LIPSEIEHLRGRIDLIAQKDGEHVLVDVKRRDELYRIGPLTTQLSDNSEPRAAGDSSFGSRASGFGSNPS